MTSQELLGYAAACCTTFSFLPQVLKIWRTRSADDISTPMYVVFTFGMLLWLFYGVRLAAWPIVIANIVTMLFAGSVLVMKWLFRTRAGS